MYSRTPSRPSPSRARNITSMPPRPGMAIAGRSTLAGVGAGIGVAFLEPLVSGLMRLGGEPWKSMPNYLIDANRDVILLQNEIPAGLPNFGPSARMLRERGVHSPAEAAMILLVYMAVFLAVGFALYRRRLNP